MEGKTNDSGVYLFTKKLTLHKQKQQHILDSRYQDAHREGLVSPSERLSAR